MQGRWRGDDGRGYDRPPHVADLPSLDAHKVDMVAFGGECTESREVATALKGENQRQDFASETFVAYPLRAQSQSAHDESLENYVAHALRADGFDASEDGTGRGTPLVAAIAIRGREGGCNVEMRTDGLANTVLTPSGGRAGIGVGAILRESTVRRLLPLECELLMGLPPGYTLIPFGRAVKAEKMEMDYAAFLMHCGCLTLEDACRAAADGPRYKSHGNSIAIPPLRWLGERIEKVLLPILALKEAKALAENFNRRLKTRSEVLAESEKQFDAIMAELREEAV